MQNNPLLPEAAESALLGTAQRETQTPEMFGLFSTMKEIAVVQ